MLRNRTLEYTGKYKEMAEQFRKNGCNGYTMERFILQEMVADKFDDMRCQAPLTRGVNAI